MVMMRFLLALLALTGGVNAGNRLRTLEAAKEAENPIKCYPEGSKDLTKATFPLCHVIEEGKVALYWSHSYTGDGTTRATGDITFAVAGKTTTWLALGLSREGMGMRDLDVALLVKNADGSFKLEDRYAREEGKPTLDDKQDKTLLWAYSDVVTGVTSFAFTMPINNCADQDRDVVILPDRYTNVVWAYGNDEQKGGMAYHDHDKRGGTALPLLVSPETFASLVLTTKPDDLPADAKVMNMLMPNVEIKQDRVTNYWCMWVEAPQASKYHIYDNKFVQDPRTDGMVHHSVVYDCQYLVPTHPVNQAFDCTEIMQQDECAAMVVYDRNLTIPVQATMAKAKAGRPFGKGVSQYWVLEVHTENHDQKAGIKDSSGWQFTYSPTLRQNDLGIMVTGAVFNAPTKQLVSDLILPPGKEEYDYVNHCTSACLKRVFPPEGVKIVNSRLHMHYLALGGSIELIRANGSVEVLQFSRVYDPHHQQTEIMTVPVDVHPGDSILTTCIYDTSEATANTTWGHRGMDEMCFGYIYFYPALHSVGCFNYQEVQQPMLNRLKAAQPDKMFTMCGIGTGRGEQPIVSAPPEEQHWQKEQRGGANKLATLETTWNNMICPGGAAPAATKA